MECLLVCGGREEAWEDKEEEEGESKNEEGEEGKGAGTDWAQHLPRPRGSDLLAVTSQASSPPLPLSPQLWTRCLLILLVHTDASGLCAGFSPSDCSGLSAVAT